MGAKKVPVAKGMRSRRKDHANKSEDVHSINTKFDKIVGESQISPKKVSPSFWVALVKSATKTDIRLYACLLVFRVLNAWVIQTSFVPDEYWQSLEVAHKAIFGYGYLTWEWRKGLRSYLYPFCFSCYFFLLKLLNLDSRSLIAKGPMFMQSILSASGDLYMYKTAYKMSSDHRVARWTLLCQLTSWYLFYSSTRTLSNSTEGSLVAIALYFFPWSKKEASSGCPAFITLVCLSIVMRPTALIVWTPMILQQLKSSLGNRHFCSLIFSWVAIGSVITVSSAAVDYLFYGDFINVYYNFFKFNVMSGLSNIYGVHQWHWYFTQGFTTVLFTHVVMLAMAILKWQHALFIITVAWTTVVYSFLPHKEFRFLSGVLPFAFHLCGMALHHYIDGCSHVPVVQNHVKVRADQDKDKKPKRSDDGGNDKRMANGNRTSKFLVTMLLVSLNAAPAIYTCVFHQRGTLDVMAYLSERASRDPNSNILFLLPCHSTPYYSHIHKNVTMNFLTCEPNLDRKDNYSDEADLFFSEPSAWIGRQKWSKSQHFEEVTESAGSPTHIIMFESLFIELSPDLAEFGFTKCAKFFHTHFPAGRISEYLIVVCK